jgi:hypothetical protein
MGSPEDISRKLVRITRKLQAFETAYPLSPPEDVLRASKEYRLEIESDFLKLDARRRRLQSIFDAGRGLSDRQWGEWRKVEERIDGYVRSDPVNTYLAKRDRMYSAHLRQQTALQNKLIMRSIS